MINNLPTFFYSIFFGKKVGVDSFGNKFFIHKKNSNKRWVLYSKQLDPTAISVEWQLWLNKNTVDIPEKNVKSLFWQKTRLPNQTGSKKAYHPKNKEYNKQKKHSSNSEDKIWRPER